MPLCPHGKISSGHEAGKDGGGMSAGFECSVLELDVIGQALEVDVRPFPFDIPVHGEWVEDRARFIEEAARGLIAKGLSTETALAPELRSQVGLFAGGRWSIAMLGTAGDRQYCARAVSNGREAVLAQRHGDVVRFDPIEPDSLVNAVVRLLPPMRPGPGGSLTIVLPDDQAKPAHRSVDEGFGQSFLEQARPARDSAGAQLASAQAILRRPRLGEGYFVITERGSGGRESEPLTVNWLDTDGGRYTIVPSTGGDGRRYATYAPADSARLAQHLTRLAPWGNP